MTFVPLDHPPGHRCEADFGHIHVDFPEGRRPVPVLIVTWSYVARFLGGEVPGGELPQLVVHERQQLGGGSGIAGRW